MTYDLGVQPDVQAASEAFLDILVTEGEDCIDGPVWNDPDDSNAKEWGEFHDYACCGYATASANINGMEHVFAATFGH